MTFEAWVKKYEGKKIDYDGVYGVQCVDLIKLYIKHVIGVQPQDIGNAIEYWNRRNVPYLSINFSAHEYKPGFEFRTGDVIVLQGSGAAGHIVVCAGKENAEGVFAYDENYSGKHAGMTLRFFEFEGKYKFVGILRPRKEVTAVKYVKILLVGNSYTYYNGYGEILSKLCKLAGKRTIVVRATKGKTSANKLITEKLGYKAWQDGKLIASGKGTLDQIAAKDFGKLGRAEKWDYIILQNNTTVETTRAYDVKAFKAMKALLTYRTHFIINCTHYGPSLSRDRLAEHKEAAKECGCSLIDTRALFKRYGQQLTNKPWYKELTICDLNYHASVRGMYINALGAFAKIFGLMDFIPLYNTGAGTGKEFITDHYKTGGANSINKSMAKLLQELVKKNAAKHIGFPLEGTTTVKTEKPPDTEQVKQPSSKTEKKVNYFPKYSGNSGSLVDALSSLKYDSSYSYRKKIAKANGIKNYAGLPYQNTKMLNFLKKGKLIKP